MEFLHKVKISTLPAKLLVFCFSWLLPYLAGFEVTISLITKARSH